MLLKWLSRHIMYHSDYAFQRWGVFKHVRFHLFYCHSDFPIKCGCPNFPNFKFVHSHASRTCSCVFQFSLSLPAPIFHVSTSLRAIVRIMCDEDRDSNSIVFVSRGGTSELGLSDCCPQGILIATLLTSDLSNRRHQLVVGTITFSDYLGQPLPNLLNPLYRTGFLRCVSAYACVCVCVWFRAHASSYENHHRDCSYLGHGFRASSEIKQAHFASNTHWFTAPGFCPNVLHLCILWFGQVKYI